VGTRGAVLLGDREGGGSEKGKVWGEETRGGVRNGIGGENIKKKKDRKLGNEEQRGFGIGNGRTQRKGWDGRQNRLKKNPNVIEKRG